MLQGGAEFWLGLQEATKLQLYAEEFMSVTEQFLVPSSTLIELAHWAVTVCGRCKWPVVLWLRVPMIIQGAWVFVINVWSLCRSVDPSYKEEKVEVYVWTPAVGANSDLPADIVNHGHENWTKHWTKKAAVTVQMAVGDTLHDKAKKEGKKGARTKGMMRDVFKLFDGEGVIFPSKSLNTSRMLVYKRYRKPPVSNCLYFKDVYMQMKAGEYAEKFSKQAGEKGMKLKVEMVHAAVMKTKDGIYYGIEPELNFAKYKKWSGNGFLPEDIFSDDSSIVPLAFSHFTFKESKGKELVCDLQGVKERNTYMLTDPQIHTDPQNAEYGMGNLGKEGIDKFFEGHRCSPLCKSLDLKEGPQGEHKDSLSETFSRHMNFVLCVLRRSAVYVVPIAAAALVAGALFATDPERTK
jgi:hypothetical protein